MDSKILSPEIQQFIKDAEAINFTKLALQKNPFQDVVWTDVLTQINCRAKAKTKLPTWYQTENIYYPPKLNLEQTSSEITALYKSKLLFGNSLIDLTGGFGVDDFYFAKRFNRLVHCELNEDLYEITKHNFEQLRVDNIDFFNADSTSVLKSLGETFDWIYIDPSRRNEAKGKVFMLKDCLPNVSELLDFYFSFSKNILIKTAPLLDLQIGIQELRFIKEIHIVAVNNEVKELLWVIEANFSGEIQYKCVNLNKDKTEEFIFSAFEIESFPNYDFPQKYLYEPNATIMKSGAFNLVGNKFGLQKLQQHSHLYTSEEIIDFPGRIFEIENVFEFNKENIKKYLADKSANITIRNFPESVEHYRKKYRIKDGGNTYAFFTTNKENHKIVILCKKV